MKIPQHYNPIMPYLIVNNAKDFMSFMKAVFNAEEQLTVPLENGLVMHGELRIGEAVIMFSDANENYPPSPAGSCLMRDDIDEIYSRAMANGAAALQEPADREYGRSAGFADKFGNKWWLMNPSA